MSAIHAVPLPAYFGKRSERGGVVALLSRSVRIGKTFAQLVQSARSGHHTGHGRPGQRIAHALIRRQRAAGRRERLIKQIAAAERLHHGDPNSHPLARLIKRLALRVHIDQRFLVALFSPQQLQVLACGLEVVAWIDAEHQHLDQPAFNSLVRHSGIVAGKSNMSDHTVRLELLRITHDRASAHLLPISH